MRLQKLWLKTQLNFKFLGRPKTLQFVLIFGLFLLQVGCGPKGPTLTDCVSDPKNNQLRCFDYSKHQFVQKTPKDIDGWVCLNPVDEKNLLMACAGKANGPLVNLCIYDFPSNEMACFDEKAQTSSHIPFANTENYVCVSGSDYQQLLTYCAQKKAGLIP